MSQLSSYTNVPGPISSMGNYDELLNPANVKIRDIENSNEPGCLKIFYVGLSIPSSLRLKQISDEGVKILEKVLKEKDKFIGRVLADLLNFNF